MLLLVAVTALWGWTFVVVKVAISQYPTVPFLALRFALATGVLAVAMFALRRRPSRRELLAGVPIGMALAAGYLLQTVGLERTTPGEAGLLTGLFVVFTPLLEGLTGRRAPLRTWTAVAVALVGMALLTGLGGGHLLGDILEVGCAAAFAIHMVLLSRWSPGLSPLPLAAMQMAVAALIFQAPLGVAFQAPPPPVLSALVITGVLASALAFLVQTWAQARLSASRTALVVAGEPAWAVFFSMLLAGQRFGAGQGAGALLLLGSILGHEVAALRARGRGLDNI